MHPRAQPRSLVGLARTTTLKWALLSLLAATPAAAAEITVSTAPQLVSAFANAGPGDVIRLMPGTYALSAALWTRRDGTAAQPILVTTAQIGDAKLEFNSVEAVVINNAYWIVERLWINGACAVAANCEAGVGVKPAATGFILRESRLSNWIQHVKAARTPTEEVSDVTLLGNEIYNDALRSNAGTAIDIVGGRRWHVVGNYIHDYGGDANGDYGIFLKGATSDGIVERNLVICAHDRAGGGATLGLSAGGGGTGGQFCPGGDCACEDTNSIFRNNIVLHCTDSGLHSRRACGSKFYNNIVYDTGAGFQVQVNSAGAPVEIRNNIMSGHVIGGNNFVQSNNRFDVAAADFRRTYRDPDAADFANGSDTSLVAGGATLPEVVDDYCGRARSAHDFGAIETPAACATWPWTPPSGVVFPPLDGGVGPAPDASTPPRDAGSPPADAGSPPRDGGGPSDAGAPIELDAGSPPIGADAAVGRADASLLPPADAGTGAAGSGEGDRTIRGGCGCTSSGVSRGCLEIFVLLTGLVAISVLLRWSRRRR